MGEWRPCAGEAGRVQGRRAGAGEAGRVWLRVDPAGEDRPSTAAAVARCDPPARPGTAELTHGGRG